MPQIYSKAANVCIWLGDGKLDGLEDRSSDFDAAMEFCEDILDPKNHERYSKDPAKAKSWSNLIDLMRCSWFSRRWIIQELAFVREATVHCGHKFIHWFDFADAIGIIVLKFDDLRALFERPGFMDEKIAQNYEYVSQMEPLGAKVLVDAISKTIRRSLDDGRFEPTLTLGELVCNLTPVETSDPRDTIFAVLNISRESLGAMTRYQTDIVPPRPSYTKGLVEVYTDFLEWMVHSEQSMDIVCRQWAPPERSIPLGTNNVKSLPGWIQSIRKSPWEAQNQGRGHHGRTKADSLMEDPGRRRYNASYGKRPEVRFGNRLPIVSSPYRRVATQRRCSSAPAAPREVPSDDWARVEHLWARAEHLHGVPRSHILSVKGMEMGTIRWTAEPVANGVIERKCLEKAGWKIPDESESNVDRLPDKLWRTLVADRTAEGDNPPFWYHRAALISMAMVVLSDPNRHFDTREPLDVSADKRPPQIVAEYLKGVQAVTWNRIFIEGAPTAANSEPLFGLAPPDTKENDRVCILFGCSVPCILRPCKSENGTQYFEFVGEAYIYGRMDGEALSTLSTDELKAQTKVFQIL
jgi:hypothetical protein